MKFNRAEYKVLHLDHKNQLYNYRKGETWPGSATCEKDLGVLVDHKLTMSQQCDAAIKKD